MNVQFVKRHVEVSDALEEYALRKSEKLARFLKRGANLEVVVDRQRTDYEVEMILSGHRGPVLVAHVHRPDARAAIDLALDKIVHQLRKRKERRRDDLHGESMAGEQVAARREAEEEEKEVDIGDVLDEESGP